MIKYTMYTVNCIKYSKRRETEIGNVKKFSIFVIKTLDARFLTLIKQSYSLNEPPKRVAFFQISFESYLTDIFILLCNRFVYLFAVFRPTREFFTHLESIEDVK